MSADDTRQWNKQAFPRVPSGIEGMTLREYTAIKAMQGLLANIDTITINEDKVAQWSVSQADALIKELSNGE